VSQRTDASLAVRPHQLLAAGVPHEALSRAHGGARVSLHNWSRTAHWVGCWSRSGCTRAQADAGERIRIAARRAASAPHSHAQHQSLRAVRQRWPAERRTAGLPDRPHRGAASAHRAARARQASRQARALGAASARRRPPRLKSGDSRSPDRTSATPGFLCRSGYTSPTIAQSLVPRFHYFKQGAK